jgi:uncharacterized damage-inducible protein DinB
MITTIAEFLKYFAGVNERAVRDVSVLPAEAETWSPPPSAGENAWGIAEIVSHMAASRLFFARAFAGREWIAEPWSEPTSTRAEWKTALRSSSQQLTDLVGSTPDGRLRSKVQPFDERDHPVSGWRLLMLMVEHDIHHRSQIDTYAGVMGWPVAHIFGRSAEQVGLATGRSDT